MQSALNFQPFRTVIIPTPVTTWKQNNRGWKEPRRITHQLDTIGQSTGIFLVQSPAESMIESLRIEHVAPEGHCWGNDFPSSADMN